MLAPAVNRRGALLDDVAILADPGGPVLGAARRPGGTAQADRLRSSPTPEGRCWLAMATSAAATATVLRSSPTPEGRCWHRPGQL